MKFNSDLDTIEALMLQPGMRKVWGSQQAKSWSGMHRAEILSRGPPLAMLAAFNLKLEAKRLPGPIGSPQHHRHPVVLGIRQHVAFSAASTL